MSPAFEIMSENDFEKYGKNSHDKHVEERITAQCLAKDRLYGRQNAPVRGDVQYFLSARVRHDRKNLRPKVRNYEEIIKNYRKFDQNKGEQTFQYGSVDHCQCVPEYSIK